MLISPGVVVMSAGTAESGRIQTIRSIRHPSQEAAMVSPQNLTEVRAIMIEFAARTGLQNDAREPRRYLWTDAYAVCNFLSLFEFPTTTRQTGHRAKDDRKPFKVWPLARTAFSWSEPHGMVPLQFGTRGHSHWKVLFLCVMKRQSPPPHRYVQERRCAA